ncbi:TELO2-interacting protein 1 [Araneus ventricosus]|uniref:TELO2-interacting protein 1 n=1 Tax=Araneus ventricosus TaxID=182803 RepID=A0A4Y2IV80_ARAVE|nr:TELO2-interacting protein 1 [Araneus ventricosus]GBM81484.1 TELO2-interacting protein 1 [Araneus ventricosus]
MVSAAFSELKPLCDKVVKDARIEDISELERVIKHIDEKSLGALQGYLLFPFRFILCRRANEAVTIKALNNLAFLFEKGRLESWQTFSGYFLQIVQFITASDETDNKVRDASEEFKCSVCLCITSLVKNSNEEVVNEIYQNVFRLPLAQAFFALIDLLKKERSKALRKIILQTVGVLTFNHQYLPLKSDRVKESASGALAQFLPGLSVALSSIICGDIKQGEGVFRTALNVLGELIVLVVGNECYVGSEKANTKTLRKERNIPDIFKDETWFKETSSKLQIVVQNSTVLVSHDNWKVRYEFLNFAKSILFNCSKHLEKCVAVLLPAVFALSVDPYENISSVAQKLIVDFSQKLESSNSLSLCSVIIENVYSSSSKLIKSKLSANDDQKLVVLRSIQGYVQILGNSIDRLLLSANHLEKFVMSLMNLLEFDISSISVLEETGSQFDVPVSSNAWPKKQFLYFQKEEILTTIYKICKALGQSQHKELLIDFLVDKLHTSELFTLQSIFLIGNIVEGFSSKLDSVGINSELVGDILEEFLSPALWDISEDKDNRAVQIYQSETSVPSGTTYSNSKLFQICLILESIAKCAKALGPEFHIFLMKVLFNVMETAGSSHYILGHSGRLCLCSISQSCGYKLVLELIRENADYIVNGITVNFHHFLYRPEMTVVLRVVIEESDGSVLPLFSDSINQVIRILDLNQDKAFPLLTVLKSVATCVRKWFPPEKKNAMPPPVQCEDLKMYFLKKKIVSENVEDSTIVSENEKEDDCDEVPEEADEKKELLHVKILSSILKRCSHLQSSKNLYIQNLSLEIMEICIVALGDYEQQQHPLVHELWNPFIHRFSEDQVVVLQAFRVLLVIADECRDFVRSRVLKDVVPKLTSLLKKSYSSSLLKNNFRNYQWTNSCKLQLNVLSEIGSLFCKLDVSEKDLAHLAQVCIPYLQNEQPRVFQEAAFKTLKALATVDADAIWWYLNETYSSQPSLMPPHKCLQAVHFPLAKTTNFELKINF